MTRLLSRVLAAVLSIGRTVERWSRNAPLRRAAVFLAVTCVPISMAWSATQYLYDDLGRLVLVAADDGSSIVYEYDANGNIVQLIRAGASGLVVGTFTPSYGHVGTTVTISGTGFSPVPAENTVMIGGATATVTASTATSITTTIPSAAVTGPISVTVGGVTATSANNIIVQYPAITSFTPAVVAPGGSVTVTGDNLNLVPGATTIEFVGMPVSVTSLSNSQAVFTAPSVGVGRVAVNTPYGDASSAANLTVIPASIGAANVVSNAGTSVGGAGVSLSIGAQNKYATLNFDAVEGQYLSVQVNSLVTTPANAYVSYYLYSSSGALLQTGSVGSSYKMSAHLPQIPATGAYFVVFSSGSSSSVSLDATLEANESLAKAGASTSSSTIAVRQSKRFTFDAVAGDDIGLAISALTITPSSPNYVRVWLYRPDGQYVDSFWGYSSYSPGSGQSYMNLSQTGTYTVLVEPQGASTMSFDLTVSDDVTGALAAGTPTLADLARVGQPGLLTFSATAGQTVAVHVGSIATTPSGKNVSITVYAPSGSALGSVSNAAQATLNLTNLPATGTYSVLLQPANAATGTMEVTLANGVTGTLPADGTNESFSTTVPRQNAYYTFSANAGDDLGIALTGLSLTPSSPNYVRFWIYRPDGYSLSGNYCSVTSTPGCGENLLNLPLTGTYKVTIEAQGDSTMSGVLTLSQDVTEALSPGTPTNVSLSVPGQLGLATFAGTAGQTVAVHVGSIATTPSGKNVSMTVYAPSGSALGSISNASQATLNLTNLPATGTYSVLLQPANAATGTMEVTLANGVTGTLPADGTNESFSTTVPRQNAYYTFSANAGDDLGIALTGLSLSPSSPNYVRFWIYRPDGYSLSGNYCSVASTPGCSENLLNLPLTGTYKVTIEAQGDSTMSGVLTLSQDVTGTLTSTPLAVGLNVAGQLGWLSFTATAGQNAVLTASSIATTPSGKNVSVTVYAPSGSAIGSSSSASQVTLNLTNLPATGTYSVLLQPANAATATLDVSVQ